MGYQIINTGSRSTGVTVDATAHRAYVTGWHYSDSGESVGTVTVIDTATNTVVDTDSNTPGVQPISTGTLATGVAVDPAKDRAYVTGETSGGDGLFVIDTTTNTVIDTDPAAMVSSPSTSGVTPTA